MSLVNVDIDTMTEGRAGDLDPWTSLVERRPAWYTSSSGTPVQQQTVPGTVNVVGEPQGPKWQHLRNQVEAYILKRASSQGPNCCPSEREREPSNVGSSGWMNGVHKKGAKAYE
jgi:hypothetical protein